MKVINRLTGKVEDLSDDEAASQVASSGGTVEYASAPEVERGERLDKYGSTGDQALAAGEMALRTGTLGLVPGFGSDEDIAGREKTLREESPGVAFASQAAGALVPGLAAGAGAGALAGAAGLGAGASGVATGVAEGLGMGTADEVEQARFEQRPVSAGLILLNGLGGELVGRAIPAVLRRGAAKAGGAMEALLGESGENLLAGAERRGVSRAARDLADIPEGAERTSVLQRGEKEHYNTAAKDVRDALDSGFTKANETSVPESKIRDLVAPDAPVQTAWGTDAAEELLRHRSTAEAGPLTAALDKARRGLLDAEGGVETFNVARAAKQELQALPQSAERDAAIQTLRDGTERVDLWGKAAELQTDLGRVEDAVAAAKAPLQKVWGQGDAFDTGKIRSTLTKDKVGRGLVQEQADAAAAAFEDMAQVRQKWDLPKLEPLTPAADKLRNAFSLADEVQVATGAVKPAKSPMDSLLGGLAREGVETAADMAMGAVGLPPVAGLAMRMLQGVGVDARRTIQQTARRLVRPVVNEAGAPIRSVITATALQRFQGDYPTPAASFEAKKNTLLQVQQNPGAFADAIAESFGSLPQENPQLFMQLSGRLTQAMQYVTDNMPSSVATSLLYPRGIAPSLSSLREFAILWNTSFHPETALDDVADGSATPDQVRILQEVHPDIYEDLKSDVVSEVSSNFGEMPSQTKVWLDILFDTDGIAGPGFSSLAAQYITESLQQDMQAKPRSSSQGLDLESTTPPAAGLQAIKAGVTNRGA